MRATDELKDELIKRLKPKAEPILGRHYSLPHKGLAFIYQRQSSYEQKRKYVWSQKDQDDLAVLARTDGYTEDLIYIERRDLGISGGKTEKDRPGLAYLISLVEQDEVESLWAVEPKRIYRDLDYINADRLALLLREHRVVICTPRQVFNLSNQNDWDGFHAEMLDSVKDTRYRTEKLSRTRKAKARYGFWPGTPVPAGYIVKKGDRSSYDVIECYETHTTIVDRIYDAFIDAQGSYLKAAQMLSDVVFPFFPEELKHMESRTALRRSPKTATGYRITPRLVHNVVQNPFYIGWWTYGGELIDERHHTAAIEETKFWQTCERSMAKGKRRGKAIDSQTLPLSGLLWCANHEVERRIAAHGARGRYVCNHDYYEGLTRDTCFDVKHEFLDKPIIDEVFRGLASSGLLLELEGDVIGKLKEEIDRSHLEQRKIKRGIKSLEELIENYKWQLGKTKDPVKVGIYWEQIHKCQQQIGSKTEEFSRIQEQEFSKEDVISVIRFLRQVREKWNDQPYGLQNQLLRQLLDKVIIRHNAREAEVTIHWHTGAEQQLWIGRTARYRNWRVEEDILLKELWHSSAEEMVMAALPGRSWISISLRARRLGLKRTTVQSIMRAKWRQWKPEEDRELARSYQAGDLLEEIAKKLGRSKNAVECRASLKKLKKTAAMECGTEEVQWENLDERVARLQLQKFIAGKPQCM